MSHADCLISRSSVLAINTHWWWLNYIPKCWTFYDIPLVLQNLAIAIPTWHVLFHLNTYVLGIYHVISLFFQLNNHMFVGGCLSSLQTQESDCCVISAGGDNFSKLCILSSHKSYCPYIQRVCLSHQSSHSIAYTVCGGNQLYLLQTKLFGVNRNYHVRLSIFLMRATPSKLMNQYWSNFTQF